MLQIIKLGSATLFDEAGKINESVLERKCKEIEESRDDTILVVSGAIALGKYLKGDTRNNGELSNVELQSYACVGQVELMCRYNTWFSKPVSQLLVTQQELAQGAKIRNVVVDCLGSGYVPIINYNDAVDFAELRLDNDSLAVEIMDYCDSDRLIILGQYDGFMDYASGEVISRVTHVDDALYAKCQGVSHHGNGGFSAKLDAAQKVLSYGKELIIGNVKHELDAIVTGRVARTLFRTE